MATMVTAPELAAITRRLAIRKLCNRRAILAANIADAAYAHDFDEVLDLLRDVAEVEDKIESYGRPVRAWSKDVLFTQHEVGVRS